MKRRLLLHEMDRPHMAFKKESIPECIRALKQWVCWRYDDRGGGKPTKVPLTIGGYGASSTDPADWYSFEDACEAAGKYDGIGFVFSAGDGFTGIDIDNCLLPGGEIKPWAVEIISQLDGTYAEISPSGTGIKFWCIAKNPMGSGRKVVVGDGAIEIYDQGRFFTVTGNVWDDNEPSNKQDVLDGLAAQYFGPPPVKHKRVCVGTNSLVSEKVERASRYLATMEPAIAGSDGHGTTFRVACKMVLGFDLDQSTAFALLWSDYNPRCVPPWSEKELRHKVEQADGQPDERGYLLVDRFGSADADGIDVSGFGVEASVETNEDSGNELDDEEFFRSMVPEDGLMREIFDYYWRTSFKRTNVIGLAIAVTLCQTIFGRRIQSHTGMRTNDYNVVLASTGTGKDACKKTSVAILRSGAAAARINAEDSFLMPSRIKSSTGLIKQIAKRGTAIWVCDELGKVLKAILDPKSKNGALSEVADDLLELYGDSNGTFLGSAYAAGEQFSVEQPHLCVLGITTSNIFHAVTANHVDDGLLGRLAFWPVQDRPRRSKEFRMEDVPESLAKRIGEWIVFTPGFSGLFPDPVVMPMAKDAKTRWTAHADAIEESMDSEGEMRAAIWARVATRAMKLALTHRAARCTLEPSSLPDTQPVEIELIDVEWGIRLANRLARIMCQLVGENIVDERMAKAKALVLGVVREHASGLPQSHFRKQRKFTGGDIRAAAIELERAGMITITETKTKGRPKTLYFPA